MRVLHAISGMWEHTGGPAESVPRLCSELVKLGNEISILTLEGRLSSAALECKEEGVDILTFPHFKQITLGVFGASLAQAKNFDIVHGHGLWLPLNWAAARAAIKNSKPFIVTTRGALNNNALKHSSNKKRFVGAFFDNRYLRAAKCIHVTSRDEYVAIRKYGLINPVAIIPNGIRNNVYTECSDLESFKIKYNIPLDRKILLYLSRISWEKGLEDLATAWNMVSPDFGEWQLVIVGTGRPEYVDKLVSFFNSGLGSDRVSWLGHLEGQDKFLAYSVASLFVLPSHTENFSLVTIEALHAGLPVITTHGTPWAELPTHGCGWWVPVGAKGVSEALHTAMRMTDEERRSMGSRGRELVDEKYAWSVIGKQMSDVYKWMLGCRDIPTCVTLD